MTGRVCGGCTLCCKLLPVKGLGKGANTKCVHARYGKGCTVYAAPPMECRLWSCQWLVDSEPMRLPRPDRAHYVVDIMPDTVEALDASTGTTQTVVVIQVWVDPAFPDAWRDPPLLAFLAARSAAEGVGALIRFNAVDALVLWPPALSASGRWEEARTEHRPGVGLIERMAAANAARKEAAL